MVVSTLFPEGAELMERINSNIIQYNRFGAAYGSLIMEAMKQEPFKDNEPLVDEVFTCVYEYCNTPKHHTKHQEVIMNGGFDGYFITIKYEHSLMCAVFSNLHCFEVEITLPNKAEYVFQFFLGKDDNTSGYYMEVKNP